MSKATVAPSRMHRWPNDSRPARKRACSLRIQYQHSGQCQIRLTRQMALEPAFIELLIVKRSEFRRQTHEASGSARVAR